MWFTLKTQIGWWLAARWRHRRQYAKLHIQYKELKRANSDLQERLYISNRDRLEAEGRAKQAQEMWVHEGTQWREQLDRVMVWLGRVAVGFGPGDSVPKPEPVGVDSISPGRVHPFDMAREILRRANLTNGRNPQDT